VNDAPVEGKTLTTPTVLNTYRHMAHAIASGCEYFIMEVSSHAIEQERMPDTIWAKNFDQYYPRSPRLSFKYRRVYSNQNLFFQDETKKLINKDEPRAQFNIKNAFSYGLKTRQLIKSSPIR